MRGRILIICLAIAAVAIAVAASGRDDDGGREPGRAAGSGSGAAADAVRISFVYSPEKRSLIEPLVARFNSERHKSGGRPVFVRASVVASGQAQERIAAGRLRPVLWSPASSFWGRLVNFEADRRLVPDENPSIVRTPLVIAMWKQLADAYGYPRRSLGYDDLARLATRGWGAVGKPQFGEFKYVHTNPDFSTSGLSAVSASYHAAAGKREGLTAADVARARPQVRRLERSIVHYGDTTLFIADEMRKRGLGYASAAAMEETTLIDFNRRAGDGAKLVAVYPEEGTFFSDNPLMTLQHDGVSAEHKRAGQVFARFLARTITPALAGRHGFRPADASKAPVGLVAAANGVDPRQPERVLRVPEPPVLARIKVAWRADRKPANVMVVFDNSGSMGAENKLEQAKAGLKQFLRATAKHDRIGLMKFSTEITRLVPIVPMRKGRPRLLKATDAILPEGDTRLNDAVLAGVNAVEAKLDRRAINAVVVLSDGDDTVSRSSEDAAVRELQHQARKESGQIRVFTIAYGRFADESAMERFAEVTGGQSYTGDTADIDSIYRSISSFF